MSGFSKRIHIFFRDIHMGGAIGGALFLVGVWLIVLMIVGSPRMLLHFAAKQILVLPAWLFLVLSFLFYAICGFCVGAILFDCRRTREVARYRGAFFFSLAITVSYLWYALFFGARFFLPALLFSAIVSLFLIVTAVNWRGLLRPCFPMMWLAVGWSVYLFVFCLTCFFFL